MKVTRSIRVHPMPGVLIRSALTYENRGCAPLFGGHAGRRSMGLEVCRVDHDGLVFAVPGRQTDHHLGEDALIAPPLPMVVQRLVRAIGGRCVTPS